MSAARLHSEPFSSVDAAWLRMDTPTNLAIITGVMTFEQPLDFERLQATIEYRWLRYPRFRQRVRYPRLPLGTPRWEDDPNFDLRNHLHRIQLPEPADQNALQELTGELMATPLDPDKPLWEFYYVENYGPGSALIGRLHHCIADGLALIQILLSITDPCADSPWPMPEPKKERRIGQLTRLILPAISAVYSVRKTLHTTEHLVHEGFDTLTHPSKALAALKQGADATKALSKLLLLSPDRKTLFKGRCGTSKRTVWSQPLLLEEVKAVSRNLGCTVNDVLLSTLTGALRRYLEENGEPVQGLNIRAVVPVNLRPPDELDKMGNRFGLIFLALPLGVKDHLKRLVVLKRRMDAIKNSPEAVVAMAILMAMGLTPSQIEDIIVSIFAMKGTAVMTNVPGPRQVLYLAGQPVRGIMFWVPAPGNLGMGISILSYASEVVLGVMTDACLISDPDRILVHFEDEFAAIKAYGLEAREAAERAETPEGEPAGETMPPIADISMAAAETARAAAFSDNGACHALTKSGQPCKNRALPGATTCRVHST